MLAPIVLFVYNRPEHTLKTLEALSKNLLAQESILYIYADGPKENADIAAINKVQETRDLLNSRKWCKEVYIIESKLNKGLASSIISGVSEIVNRYGKIIVLEDDIITSPGFLKYMNDALNFYENNRSVMHVSGYMFPVKSKLPSTFFYNTCSCWGWGTWKNAWNMLRTDSKMLYEEIQEKKLLNKFNIEGSAGFEEQLVANIEGRINTWAVKWYATLFLNNGFSLHPYPSLVNNIGFDLSGENCGPTEKFNWPSLGKNIEIKKIKVIESKKARRAMVKFYKGKSDISFKEKLERRTKKVLPTLIKTFIKKSIRAIGARPIQKSLEQVEIERIKAMARYTPGTTNLVSSAFKFVDSASFIFTYDEIFKKEIYKFETTKEDPYIIDCGANIGLSIHYFKKLYPKSQVLAFEPDPKVFEVLISNTNSFNNVYSINKALWIEETILNFHSEGADAGSLASIPNEVETIEIQTERLSKYLDKEVDFLKIDIEGAELKVLEDCKDKLHLVKNLFVEYHSFENSKQDLATLINILERNSFRYHITSPGLSSPHPFINLTTYNGMDMQLNIYAFK